MPNWVKLNLFYLGKSKKHHIFRTKRWNKNLEKILHNTVFTEKYEEIGYIKEIIDVVEQSILPFLDCDILAEYNHAIGLPASPRLIVEFGDVLT